ncbi:hypothetical protein SAY87_013116 [Trapa incisa]|uniref:Uncharacterized protein n=1 Tax=Trapa incisa TaxID=236973 RepID=A0AAN7K870_9MYRT|nr:hypothetical protein SAY87_013116 [Trapa incisa]
MDAHLGKAPPHHHQLPPRVLTGEMDGERYWLVAEIPLRAPLRPISTNPCMQLGESDEEEDRTTTPTAVGSRIPAIVCLPPPPPRKRKPSLKFRYDGAREFFTPPVDMESLFVRRESREGQLVGT